MFGPLTVEGLLVVLLLVAVSLATASVWRMKGAGNAPASAADGDIAQRFEAKMRVWGRITQALEHTLLDNLAATTPWLAPVLPAAIAYFNLTLYLDFPHWLAFLAAVCIEFLGLAAVHTVFQLWQYNESRRAKDVEAPVRLASAVGVAYMVVVLTVNVLLEVAAFEAWTWQGVTHVVAKALLSLLSVVSAFVLAIRAQHQRLIVEQGEDKAQRAEAVELGRLRQAVPRLKQQVDELRQVGKEAQQAATAAQRERDKLAATMQQREQAKTALQQQVDKMKQALEQARQGATAAQQSRDKMQQTAEALRQERNSRETAERQLAQLAEQMQQMQNTLQQLETRWNTLPLKYQAAVDREVQGLSLRDVGKLYDLNHTTVDRASKELFGTAAVPVTNGVLNGSH